MNQILATSNENNKNNKKNDSFENSFSTLPNDVPKKPINIKKIIVIFCIAIGIFGLVLVGVYGYKIYNENKDIKKNISKPDLTIQQNDNTATISAKSEIGINKIIYYWDETDKKEIQVNDKTSYEKMIDIPNGESTLIVQVIDKNGQKVEETQNFSINGDVNKPTIELEVIEENGKKKAKITAKDEVAMKYITYRWNSEEEVKINVENDTDTTIETTIEIQRGENTLTITAVDAADNKELVDKPFKAGNKPIISVLKDGNTLIMKITHDKGFKKVEFSLNDKIYTYDENFSEYNVEQAILEYTFALQEGETFVKITAISVEDTEETYEGKCIYTAE